MLEHLEAENGNIFLIDSILHTPYNKNDDLHQLHGYGRNSISGDSPFYLSKAYENNTAAAFINNNLIIKFSFIIYTILFMLA